MSSRSRSARRNDEAEEQTTHKASGAEPSPPASSNPAPGEQGKSPSRMIMVLWGIPLVLFVIIAVLKHFEVF